MTATRIRGHIVPVQCPFGARSVCFAHRLTQIRDMIIPGVNEKTKMLMNRFPNYRFYIFVNQRATLMYDSSERTQREPMREREKSNRKCLHSCLFPCSRTRDTGRQLQRPCRLQSTELLEKTLHQAK